MHLEILNNNQVQLLPYLKLFKRSFYLVGGTAIAFHIGYRRSIDFDLFTKSPLNKGRLREKLNTIPFKKVKIFEDIDQSHLLINDVKTTFFSYPFQIEHNIKCKEIITIPSLLDLAAMKAFALGRRSKWKDYVDLFFIIKDYHKISEIGERAKLLFKEQFSEKLFREQLAFHKDIDYSEEIEYLVAPVPENEIKEFLIEKAIDIGI